MQIPEKAKGLTILTPRLIAAAKARNIDVHVWTVNDPGDMRRLIDMGVDGIITDYPDRMFEMLNTAPVTTKLSPPTWN